jgi:gamma-glutamylcyclotransferase (GGCT)/AIG2-like uncharacterized protein YtfP
MNADHCLATYGTLAPGKPNHRQLAMLRGEWLVGKVKGILVAKGWGAAVGFPALALADDGNEIKVHVFISTDLPDHWNRLDAFEGSEYRRVVAQVKSAKGSLEAWIYVNGDPVV